MISPHVLPPPHSSFRNRLPFPSSIGTFRSSRASAANASTQYSCLRCGKTFTDQDNRPNACAFHGHMTGERGMFTLAPPHQGIDGEWTEDSGIIVYRWNDAENRPNTGKKNWKCRWTCCGIYDKDAPPCRHGWHVSYDHGATRF